MHKILLTALSLAMSTAAFAHSGHGAHGVTTASHSHAAPIAAGLVLALVAVVLAYQRKRVKRSASGARLRSGT